MTRPKASPEQVEQYLKQCLLAKEKGLEVKIFWTTYKHGYPEGKNLQGHVVSYHAGVGQVTLEVVGFDLKKISEVIILDVVTRVEEIPDPAELHKDPSRQGADEADPSCQERDEPTQDEGEIKEDAPSRLRPPEKTGLDKKK